MTTPQFEQVIKAIDDINRQDPNVELDGNEPVAKELLYSRRMSQCLSTYWPEAEETLRIAVHAQHIKRWHLKRAEFEAGRSGYMLWRKELGKLHASLTHELMLNAGYNSEDADQTASILRKEKLKTSELSQTLEDVACLVFLQFYFDDFASKHDEDKLIDIVQKTWRKMSEKGHNIALTIDLAPHLASIVQKALA